MKTLAVISGATASGKSALALELALTLDTPVISADSRQIYRALPIGTAAPSTEERAAVNHYFVGTLELDEYFSASMFEQQALEVIGKIFESSDVAVMCGGSMMYVDAVVNGLDELPTISAEVRSMVADIYRNEGYDAILERLRLLDPEYFAFVDRNNHKRTMHALEIIIESGQKYSMLRSGKAKKRDFSIREFAIDMPREVLYERINSRVDAMMEQGFLNEARSLYPYRELNSLNTVGYKELFNVIDGVWTLDFAVEKIKRNTRVYAKKQLTWLKKRPHVEMLDHTLTNREKVERIIRSISAEV